MKLFNDNINLTAEDINTETIESDNMENIFFPINNHTIKSNFESKYEERKVKTMSFIWIDEFKQFVLHVDYDNDEFIQITDKSVYSFVLTDDERAMLHSLAGIPQCEY